MGCQTTRVPIELSGPDQSISRWVNELRGQFDDQQVFSDLPCCSVRNFAQLTASFSSALQILLEFFETS
jgi:hypothetical protein